MTQGVITFAINYGNPVLAHRDSLGLPAGVSIDLAHRIAEILSTACQFRTFESAKDATAAVGAGACDIGFFADDPARAERIAFTRPYLAIDGNYLVRDGSPYLCNEDVDQAGVLVGVGSGSAYDLFLTRHLRHATLVRESTSPKVVHTFLQLDLDVAAGVRAQLEADAARVGGLRLIEPSFMQIRQAIGMTRSLETSWAGLLDQFVIRSIEDGSIAEMLQRHGVRDALVSQG